MYHSSPDNLVIALVEIMFSAANIILSARDYSVQRTFDMGGIFDILRSYYQTSTKSAFHLTIKMASWFAWGHDGLRQALLMLVVIFKSWNLIG